MRIAILEDDPHQGELMKIWLEDAGHHCQLFLSGKDCIRGLAHDSFDMAIIDWLLPDIGGDEVLAWIREHIDWMMPVLFVTARHRPEDIVKALEMGADDYMTKPVKRTEMLARINALARRSNINPESKIVSMGNIEADTSRRQVRVDGQQVELTGKEYELALFLLRHTGRILSRGHIMESVWGRSANLNTRTVDTHISRIRKKLNLVPDKGWRLTAIYQHGYRLEQTEDEEFDRQAV